MMNTSSSAVFSQRQPCCCCVVIEHTSWLTSRGIYEDIDNAGRHRGAAVNSVLVLGLTPSWVHPVPARIKVWCCFNCCQGFRKQKVWCNVYRKSPLKAGTVFFTLSQLSTIRHSEDHHRIEGDWSPPHPTPPKNDGSQGVSDAFHLYILLRWKSYMQEDWNLPVHHSHSSTQVNMMGMGTGSV